MPSEDKKPTFRFDLKNNNRPFIFLVCLLIATTLWFIKAMEKNYETTVTLPVRYTNIPQNNVLVNPPPTRLSVKIKAPGFTLLRNKVELSITPVNLSLKPFTREAGHNTLPSFYILSDRFIPQISEQVNSSITVIDISPDTLFFNFDYVTEKKVKVVSGIIANCRSQYFVSDPIKITPSEITVRGPSDLIDTLTAVITSTVKFNELNAPLQSTVSLQKIDQVDYSLEKVTVDIPVAQFTEYNERVAVGTINKPDNIDLILFPAKVNVSCLIAYDKFKTMNGTEFSIGVDYNDISTSTNVLPVKVMKKPDFIKSLKIQPSQVEYIIKKK